MDRLVRRNVLALSGRAVEASGDVDVLLLDKTGTITLGNRQAAAFVPMPGVTEAELAEAAQLASLADETPEGRSIVVLAKQYGLREHDARPRRRAVRAVHRADAHERRRHRRHPAAQGRRRRDPRAGSRDEGGQAPPELAAELDRVAREGGDAAGRRARQPGPRRRLPQGRRQGGHARALRPPARDGHPHGHGHRRQPADGGQDRRGGGRRRLPRRGDAGGEARR